MQENVRIAEEMPEVFAVLRTQVVFSEATSVASQLRELQGVSPTYQAALQELQSRNLQVSADAAPPFGWSVLDESVLASQVQSLTFIQDLGSRDGQDVGLMGVVVSGVDESGLPVRDERWEIMEKPSAGVADLSDIRTVAVFQDGSKVTGDFQALSILSRFTKCIRGSCASTCLGVLTTCIGAFPIYVKCVAVGCGGCTLKCSACAGCNCGRWCKWAAGCCRE